MVGDGINDAPAIAAATVGVVLALRASATAVAVADVLILQDAIDCVPYLIAKAHQTTTVVSQGKAWMQNLCLCLHKSRTLRKTLTRLLTFAGEAQCDNCSMFHSCRHPPLSDGCVAPLAHGMLPSARSVLYSLENVNCLPLYRRLVLCYQYQVSQSNMKVG